MQVDNLLYELVNTSLHYCTRIHNAGAWTEGALGNLQVALGNMQKILKVVSNQEVDALEGDGFPRKRVCIRVSMGIQSIKALHCKID